MVNDQDYIEVQVEDEQPYRLWDFQPPKTKWFFLMELLWAADYRGGWGWRLLLYCLQFLITPVAIALTLLMVAGYGVALLLKDMGIRLWRIFWSNLERLISHLLSPIGVFLRVLAFVAAIFVAIWFAIEFNLWQWITENIGQ